VTIKGLLFHEQAHYLTAVHFGGLVPPVINEGISTHFESRLNTEPYIGFRSTDRQRTESDARNALNTIVRLPDFLKMLDGVRGFGRGDAMVRRWYGIGYAIVDFFSESELNGKKTSFDGMLAELDRICRAQRSKIKASKQLPTLSNREVLEQLVQKLYGVDLATFHGALVQYIAKTYRRL
jgi:hypothetical protein